MPLNYEYPQRLQVGYIGGGEHSYRHILPALRYAPIELLALADHNTARGLEVARQFGAKRFYPNHKALLAKEKLDAVLIVVGPDEAGRPRYPEIAAESLSAGLHTWVDAPPCSSAAEVKTFTDACLKGHKYVVTGFRRMFVPAYVKLSEIIADPAFGASSFVMHYVSAAPQAAPGALFLDFLQPYSALLRLFGEARGLSVLRKNQDWVVTLRFRDVVGALHIRSQAAGSAGERLEVIGAGGSVVVERGLRLVHHRAGGQDLEHLAEAVSLYGEPDLASTPLADASPVLSGYVGCLRHLSETLLQGEAPRHGNLVDMLHAMTVHDKLVAAKEETWVTL